MISPAHCFSYDLPPDRIAQRPVYPYDAAKMLVARRGNSALEDRTFADFPTVLRSKDLVVFNNSRVIPARLFGRLFDRDAEIEILLLREVAPDRWSALARPLKKLKVGSQVIVSDLLRLEVLEKSDTMEIVLGLAAVDGVTSVRSLLAQIGTMPVPPYIRNGRGDDRDLKDYQPLLAKVEGSVASPTASLHFTENVFAQIRASGATIAEATLHVGSPSFLPLWRPDQDSVVTPPSSERFVYSRQLVEQIVRTKKDGGRVIAVGTTVTRALETMMRSPSSAKDGETLETDIFITPGFEWRAVDVLVTNFHQPHTSHLLLVEAFMGRAALESSYRHALAADYRFLSYGDGMVVLGDE